MTSFRRHILIEINQFNIKVSKEKFNPSGWCISAIRCKLYFSLFCFSQKQYLVCKNLRSNQKDGNASSSILTNTRFLIRVSRWSLLVGDVANTYSTILTPRPPVSEERGDNMFAASLPGKLPDLLGTMDIGCETAWSAILDNDFFKQLTI